MIEKYAPRQGLKLSRLVMSRYQRPKEKTNDFKAINNGTAINAGLVVAAKAQQSKNYAERPIA